MSEVHADEGTDGVAVNGNGNGTLLKWFGGIATAAVIASTSLHFSSNSKLAVVERGMEEQAALQAERTQNQQRDYDRLEGRVKTNETELQRIREELVRLGLRR